MVKASAQAGVERHSPHHWRKTVPGFTEAEAVAMRMSVEYLRDEARRRAVEGTRLYKHHPKTGEPLAHPELCLCEHGLRSHAGDQHQGACGECDCARFRGAPYYEHSYSDRLLERLLVQPTLILYTMAYTDG